MRSIAILGNVPNGTRGPVRAGSFKQLQTLVGALESASTGDCFALHAACHAFMNGVDRVVVLGVGDEPTAAALRRLQEDVDLVLAPDMPPAHLEGLLNAWRAASRGRALLLDPPTSLTAAEVPQWIEEQGVGSDPNVLVCWPPAVTHSPGRRNAEPLPASAIVSALLTGACATLKGLHEVPRVGVDDASALKASRVVLLQPEGMRQKLGLAWPEPLGRDTEADAPDRDDGLDGRMQFLLNDAMADLFDGRPNDAALWRTIERRATVVLSGMEARGEIAGYHVRCDPETNDGSETPVVEVLIRQPKRVRELKVRLVGN